jgi:outer membrane protein OmpU
MKKVLLTTTAVVFTAGFASAGDMSMSGAIKLTYGAFGSGSTKAGADAWTSEADLDIAASSASGTLSMSGTLEIDEGATASGPVTLSAGALSLTYDANDIGGLAVDSDADGEDDDYADYTVSYAAGPISATYTGDHETDDQVMAVTYAAGALTLGVTSTDESNGGDDGDKNVMSATYVTGPYTIALSGDDQASQDWDASIAMVSGDTTVTLAADETEMMSVGIAYTAGAMTVTARQEFNNAAGTHDETEFSVGYTEGAMTFSAAYDSGQGQTAHYGDEA